MKKILLICFLGLAIFSCQGLFAQTVVITDDATYTTGAASSVLDVKSITKGFLVPRMTASQRTAISAPSDGLLVYQTDGLNGFYNYNGSTSSWVAVGSASTSQWAILGNSGTSITTNFLGTTDNTSLRFRTNNSFRMVIDSIGSVGIGSVNFNSTNREKLLIDAQTTTSVTALYAAGTINNYFQLNIRNLSNGTTASSDLIATADNGSETTNYVDLGINGSGYTPTSTGKQNDGYLISNGNDFYVQNLNAAKDLIFSGGTGPVEKMRIMSTGRVGIGVTNPSNPLVVKDTLEIKRTGTISELLFSNTNGSGDFKIAGDGGDLFWQGGGGRSLQMGSYWTTILAGDRETSTLPSPINGLSGTCVLVQGQRDASVTLAIQSNSSSQTSNLTEWRSATPTTLSYIDKNGNYFGPSANLNSGAVASIPLIVKGFAGQTGDLTDWKTSAGVLLSSIDKSGNITAPSATLISTAVANIPLIVKAIASQTGNLQEWRNSGGTAMSNVDATGNFNGPAANLTSTAVANVPLTVKGIASQTGDLAEFKNSAGTVLSAINAAGQFTGSLTSGGSYGTGTFGTPSSSGTAVANIYRIRAQIGSQTGTIVAGGNGAFFITANGIGSTATVTASPESALPTGAFVAYCYGGSNTIVLVLGSTSGTAATVSSTTWFDFTVVQ